MFDEQTIAPWEVAEWTVDNPSYTGEPYEIDATATFTHRASGEKRTTGFFFDGDTFAVRFVGSKPGTWTVETSSEQLDIEASGRISVDGDVRAVGQGFVTGRDEKWSWSATGEAFAPQLAMHETPDKIYDDPDGIADDIETFLEEHGFDGFHVPVEGRWFDLYHPDASDQGEDPTPDPRTFEALERVIRETYAAGGFVHLWAWTAPRADQAPVRWGVNGRVDRRLQRYLAARLGPLPGWTMGYGVDLNLWHRTEGPYGAYDLSREELESWHDYLHEHMGWRHMLAARWVSREDEVAHKTEIGQWSDAFEIASYQRHRLAYDDYVDVLEFAPDRPNLEADRFRIRNSEKFSAKDYDERMTRRGLWHATMAGGVANIWGNLIAEDGSDHPQDAGSLPYPNADQVQTYALFWEGRFRPDLVRDNDRTDHKPGVEIEAGGGDLRACLRSDAGEHFLFYAENASGVTMDLSGLSGQKPAVAVDAKTAYRELEIGPFDPGEHVWESPHESDWAVAVGEF